MEGSNAENTLQCGDMLAYQDDAIVSKTLLKKESGNITLFAFDKGQGLSEHTSPFDAMLYLLDGLADIRISGISHAVSAGDIIRLPAGEPHALQATEKFKMMLIMIK